MLDSVVAQQELSSNVISWSRPKRLLFRFVFCYLALYLCPTPISEGLLGFIPGSSAVAQAIARAWMKSLPWFAVHLFRFSGAAVSVYRQSGSGDKALDYVMVLVLLFIAGIASLVWSVADTKRPHYLVLESWLRLGVRYFLIYQMLAYGANKIIPVQFPEPRLTDLLTPIGLRSPAGAYWTLMGTSPGYVIFAGTTEIAAALLLVFNRTKAIGAFVTVAVLSNIVAMNLGFNLGVKLFSIHLLAMAVFLVLPHLRVVTEVFLLNKTARLIDDDFLARKSRTVRTAVSCAKVVVLSVYVIGIASFNLTSYKAIHSRPGQTPLYGIYNVDAFVHAGREVPPLSTNGFRWKKVILQTPTGVVVQVMTDVWPWPWYRATYDPDKKTLVLFDVETRSQTGRFVYSQVDSDHVVLDGTFENEPLVVRLSRVSAASFPLFHDRFSWVHETSPSNQ